MTHRAESFRSSGNLEPLPAEVAETIDRWTVGAVSAPIALLTLINRLREPARVASLLEPLLEQMLGESDSSARRKAAEMKRLLRKHPRALEEIGELLSFERQLENSWSGDPAARWATLFDALVHKSEEASVALYSLGDPALLHAATAEVVKLLNAWDFLASDRIILQIGCGIGRFEAAVAQSVKMACGIDVSAQMIAAARRRCAGMPNVHLLPCSGRDLQLFKSGMFYGVYAVDTFPYLHASGELLATHFQETHRVLRPQGEFVLMNFSYRGSLEADRLEICQLAEQHGFDILQNGIQPFEIWDGAVWRLRRFD